MLYSPFSSKGFYPEIWSSSLFTVFSTLKVASPLKMKIVHFDIKNVFLNRDLQNEINMRQLGVIKKEKKINDLQTKAQIIPTQVIRKMLD